ncbi:MAG: hypothetical protein ABSG32_23540 [Terriglobia bacterium]
MALGVALVLLAMICAKGAGRGAAIVSVKAALPVPAALVALRVTAEVPVDVGVPEIKPVVLLTDSPAGNPVAS